MQYEIDSIVEPLLEVAGKAARPFHDQQRRKLVSDAHGIATKTVVVARATLGQQHRDQGRH